MSEFPRVDELRGARTVTWRDVLDTFVRYRITAISTFVVVVTASVAITFLMTPIYRSEVLVVPAQARQSSPGLSQLGQFGALAGLVGIDLPVGGDDMSIVGIEILKSRGFLAEFIDRNHVLPELFTADWDPAINDWTVDLDDVPTVNDGVVRFGRNVLKIDDGGAGGTIRIGIEWRDREFAAQWANEIVALLNERMRQRAIEQATNSLQYLESQLEETTAVEVRQSIYRLIEEQLNNLMLANVQREYAFEVLDSATPSERDRPQRPQRALNVLLGVFAGIALAAFLVALRSGFSRAQ